MSDEYALSKEMCAVKNTVVEFVNCQTMPVMTYGGVNICMHDPNSPIKPK